jgi:hypothetical protein
VKQADSGALKFQYERDPGALKIEARDLLRRALSIARAMGSDQTAGPAARAMAADLRVRSFEGLLPIPALWFGHLDLDLGISDPGEVGKEIEALIAGLAGGADAATSEPARQAVCIRSA